MVNIMCGYKNILSSVLRASDPASHDATRNGEDEANSTSGNDDPHQRKTTADFRLPFFFPSLLLPALFAVI